MTDSDSPQDEIAGTQASERLQRYRDIVARYPTEFHDYAFLLNWMDRFINTNLQLSTRVSDLLEANNRLVSERNVAIGRATHFEMSVDWLLRHNGIQYLRRLESENRTLVEERDEARHQLHQARAEAGIHRDAAINASNDRLIADAARMFFQRLQTLDERSATDPTSIFTSLLIAYEDLKAKALAR